MSMRKKFKKMNLSEKRGYIKQKEFEMQRYEYEKQVLELKKQVDTGGKINYDTDSSVEERAKVGASMVNQKFGGSQSQRAYVNKIGNYLYTTHQKDNILVSNNENLKNLKETTIERLGQNLGSDLLEKLRGKGAQIIGSPQSGFKTARHPSLTRNKV